MKYGYARVSTEEQNLDRQLTALEREGCEHVFQEKVSGIKSKRPELSKLLETLNEGDVLVVKSIDRLSRSTADLMRLIDELNEQSVGFKSIDEPFLDTTSPHGELLITIFSGLAQFERNRILERTRAGQAEAKKRGVKFGRPSKLTEHQKKLIRQRLSSGEPHSSIAKDFNVSKWAIQRLNKQKVHS